MIHDPYSFFPAIMEVENGALKNEFSLKKVAFSTSLSVGQRVRFLTQPVSTFWMSIFNFLDACRSAFFDRESSA